jgi:hypothetical protein
MTARTRREETIMGMCLTMRHDFGLQKINEDSPWQSGMTNREREALVGQMSQLYDHHVAPIQQELDALNYGDRMVLPKNREHAKIMLITAMQYLGIKPGEDIRYE